MTVDVFGKKYFLIQLSKVLVRAVSIGGFLLILQLQFVCSAPKQVLKAIGIGSAADLSQLPTILAFGWREQTAQIGHGALSGLGTAKTGPIRRSSSAQ
jgi:hypothetical protein